MRALPRILSELSGGSEALEIRGGQLDREVRRTCGGKRMDYSKTRLSPALRCLPPMTGFWGLHFLILKKTF